MAVYDLNGNIIAQGGVISNHWSIGADLIRKPISLFSLGTPKYAQSFCVYDGKFYTTDGSHVAEQSSDFTVLRDVSLSLGHGNGFQLGSNGKAYVSGWNDQKIYIVDLATLTITNTITLPTTGYTTCAVDDVKQIAYIFQRASYPDTEDYYNFIVYDYANSQTLKTVTTSIKFAAMQSADMFMDVIIVLAGMGTSAAPNKYMMFSTDGVLLSEYHIGGAFLTQEPEGICIDRDTQESYISFYTLNASPRVATVYKMEGA